MTKYMRTKLRRELKHLVNILGYAKEDKKTLCEDIKETTEEIKEISAKLKINKISGEDYRMVLEKFKKESVDWKALAMSYKPSKAKLKKYTTIKNTTRLKTFEIN